MKRLLGILLALLMAASMTACTTEIEEDVFENDAPLVTSGNTTEELSSSSSSLVIEPETPPKSGSESEKADSSSSSKESSGNTSSPSVSKTSVSSASSSSGNSAASSIVSSVQEKTPAEESKPVSGEVCAVWISYLELQPILQNKTEKQFSSSVETMFSNLENDGFNTVYVHARSHSDAFYDSDIFPWSVYCTGTEGKDPGFDPLSVMVTKAHAHHLKIEAWINPYRVKGTTDTSKISSGSPAYDWLDTDKVISVSGSGIFYNPADEEVINLVVSGVEEIIRNYDVDGIHFDDYFYPTTDESFDASYYRAYKNGGGTLSLAAWRRQNVNTLIKRVYSAIKSVDSGCRFGISPTGNMDSNFSSLYCDVATWVTCSGYIDYICPQIYYGFNHGSKPYLDVLSEFNDMITCRDVELIVGLAAYKSGAEDTYAGSGKKEWIENTDILSRQIIAARNESHYGGFSLYRYDSLYHPSSAVSTAIGEEKDNLQDVM